MTIQQTSSITGIFSIVAGLFIAAFSFNPSPAVKYVLVLALIGTGIFAGITASKSKKEKIRLKDYRLTASLSFIYAIALILYATSLQQFLTITAAFVLLFGLSHFMFTFQALNYKGKARLKIVLLKGVTGLIVAFTAGLTLATTSFNAELALLILGIAKVFIGISLLVVTKSFNQVEYSQPKNSFSL